MSKDQVLYRDHHSFQRIAPYGVTNEGNNHGSHGYRNLRGAELREGSGGVGVGSGYGGVYYNSHHYGLESHYNNSSGYPQNVHSNQYGSNNNNYHNFNSDNGRHIQETYYKRYHPGFWSQQPYSYEYQYGDQKFGPGEHTGGGPIGNQRVSKFSNGSNKWDRSNNNINIYNNGNVGINNRKLQNCNLNIGNENNSNNSEDSLNINNNLNASDEVKVAELTEKQVEKGVRVLSQGIKKETTSDSSSISVFHVTGEGSIWARMDVLNDKKLCYECQKIKWKDKITPLCNHCYKNLSSSGGHGSSRSSKKECIYCKIEFLQHRILKKAAKVFGKVICMECCRNLCKYNTDPIRCHFCDCWSAWSSNFLCDRCTSSRETYGEPLPCDMCRKVCAFDRGEDSKKKVDGRLFCFLCTIKYKKLRYEEVKKTNSIYLRAEKALTKINPDKKNDDGEAYKDSKDLNDNDGMNNDCKKHSSDTNNDNIDWKSVAEERMVLYEKAKQHLTEIKSKELSEKIETGSIISRLKEDNSNLESQNKQLEETILHLNAKLNDWELKMNNIYEEKQKQIKELKDEKKRILEEMQDIIEKLKDENKELKIMIKNNSTN
ncbi:hypothetical protein FG379_002181 [Cryptosporidium bovis]|uniref:uncharacterized protein n=1 Tax=Cryptosporidium bovis TaxID=310047 RepID=UPI00351A2761|nr:hypothetical protein FG379_002181 [Cryptosporidium bovis]